MLPDDGVEIVDQTKEQRHGERVKSDADFEQPIGAHRSLNSGAGPSGQRAAQRQSAHEGGQHCAHGQRGRSENEAQHARPEHFINQPGGAGQEKNKQQPVEGSWADSCCVELGLGWRKRA